MKSKAKSVHVFELRIWSKKYFGNNASERFRQADLWGFIKDAKSNRRLSFKNSKELSDKLKLLYDYSETEQRYKFSKKER